MDVQVGQSEAGERQTILSLENLDALQRKASSQLGEKEPIPFPHEYGLIFRLSFFQ